MPAEIDAPEDRIVSAVRKLFERYDNVPASLADACLIRLSGMYESSRVLTLDSDFHVYRRHGRKVIALLRPQGAAVSGLRQKG